MQVYRLTKSVGRSLLAKAVHQSLLHGLTGTFASKLRPHGMKSSGASRCLHGDKLLGE